jgi:hypothetical protein
VPVQSPGNRTEKFPSRNAKIAERMTRNRASSEFLWGKSAGSGSPFVSARPIDLVDVLLWVVAFAEVGSEWRLVVLLTECPALEVRCLPAYED